MTPAPHYSIQPGTGGRWLVCHRVPGTRDTLAIDADCPSQAAAERECAWLEAERQRELRRMARERELLYRAGRALRGFA